MLMGELATLVKYRLPVKVIILKHSVRGMIGGNRLCSWGIPSTASSRNHLSLRLLLKLVRSGDPANNPKLVESVLQGALNHPGTVIVQAVVDLARIIHDGSLRNRAVAKRDKRAETEGRSMLETVC